MLSRRKIALLMYVALVLASSSSSGRSGNIETLKFCIYRPLHTRLLI
jgi:hypothetical protein